MKENKDYGWYWEGDDDYTDYDYCDEHEEQLKIDGKW